MPILYKIPQSFKDFLIDYLSTVDFSTNELINQYLESEDCILADAQYDTLNVSEIKSDYKVYLKNRITTKHTIQILDWKVNLKQINKNTFYADHPDLNRIIITIED